jgi:hypothetical protein
MLTTVTAGGLIHQVELEDPSSTASKKEEVFLYLKALEIAK